MSSQCRGPRVWLGAYVLGALEPAERAELETHLADCPACREELAGLAGLPGLLSQLSVDDLDAPAADSSPPVLARTLDELAARRRSRRRRRPLVAAAAVLIVGGAGVLGATIYPAATRDNPAAVAAAGQTLSATDPRTHVHGSAALVEKGWGTAIQLRLHGVPRGTRCRLVTLNRGGQTQVAGTWQATYEATTAITTATSIARDNLRSLRVLTADNALLVAIPVPPR